MVHKFAPEEQKAAMRSRLFQLLSEVERNEFCALEYNDGTMDVTLRFIRSGWEETYEEECQRAGG